MLHALRTLTLGSIDTRVVETRTDLNSHADQCAIGSNALIFHDFVRPINVTGYDPKGPVHNNLCTVSAALAYDDGLTGESVILVILQANLIPDLDHNLQLTMQLPLNDVTVNDVPRFLTEKPTLLTHSLVVPTDNIEHPYVIPMTLHGVASLFPTRKPTVEEFESLPQVILTSEEPAYNPHDTSIAEHEDALAKAVLETGDRIGAPPPKQRCPVSKTLPSSSFDGTQLSLQQISIVNDAMLCETMRANISTVRLASSDPQLTPQVLSINWGIDLKTPARTVKATTERGICTVLHPTLSRRLRTNDRQLRYYRRLPIDCFTDTLFSNTTSRCNNKCKQTFATADGWCRAFLMSKKSQAHEGLSLLLQREGAQNTMKMDGTQEQVMAFG